MKDQSRRAQSGFTLIEMLIALALFSLIGIAGFTLVSGILRVQERTEGRLERLAQLQRAMYLLTFDLEQVADGVIEFDGGGLSFRRSTAGRGPILVRYDLADGALRRILSAELGTSRTQLLIAGVGSLRWHFFARGTGWSDDWPPNRLDPGAVPNAVAADLTLVEEAGEPAGVLRRLVRLPDRFRP